MSLLIAEEEELREGAWDRADAGGWPRNQVSVRVCDSEEVGIPKGPGPGPLSPDPQGTFGRNVCWHFRLS